MNGSIVHPLDPLSSRPKLCADYLTSCVYPKESIKHLDNIVYMVGYYINTKSEKQHPWKHYGFGTFIDSKRHFFDTVHFPQTIEY